MLSCPICHSSTIKYHKIHSKGKWWSRCISGLDHGVLILPDGSEIDIGVTYSYLYFTDDGEFSYEGAMHYHGRVQRQARR